MYPVFSSVLFVPLIPALQWTLWVLSALYFYAGLIHKFNLSLIQRTSGSVGYVPVGLYTMISPSPAFCTVGALHKAKSRNAPALLYSVPCLEVYVPGALLSIL